jgi:hypothetical protein
MFWSDEITEAWQAAVEAPKMELRNIIPLSPEAHKRWDRHYFALRQIKHKLNDNVLYVQLCYSNPIDFKTGERGDVYDREFIDIQGQDEVGGLCDWRDIRDNNGAPYVRAIRSGDVFRLTTPDPGKYPLPDYNILALQWALHRVLGSLKAAGALRAIFGDDPPDDAPAVPSGGSVLLDRSLLAYLADIAEDKGIMTPDTAAKWRGVILKAMYEELLSKADFLRDVGQGQHLPPIPTFDEFLAEEETAAKDDEEIFDGSGRVDEGESHHEGDSQQQGRGVKPGNL